MRVVLLGDLSGTRNGRPWPPRGSTIDLPDGEAALLCRQGMARPDVDRDAGVERAVVPEEPVVEKREPLTTERAGAVGKRTKRSE